MENTSDLFLAPNSNLGKKVASYYRSLPTFIIITVSVSQSCEDHEVPTNEPHLQRLFQQPNLRTITMLTVFSTNLSNVPNGNASLTQGFRLEQIKIKLINNPSLICYAYITPMLQMKMFRIILIIYFFHSRTRQVLYLKLGQ